MQDQNAISSDFPFESRYLNVRGSKIHYIDEGQGDPILFLHGNPTSSYLWRNIIPHLTDHARCIAPDLIGMGKSDKPKLDYRFFTHYSYIEAFIEQLGLENVTLVIHDWGSGIGFHYAHLHEQNVKGIAFMEAIINTITWEEMPGEFRRAFRMLRTPVLGWFMASVMNGFVKQLLPQTIVRKLKPEEMAAYKAPYPTIGSRKPVRQWPLEVPISGKPADVHEAVKAYNAWLQQSSIPKLFFHAKPGAVIRKRQTEWVKENLPNTTSVDIGSGIHFVQEDHPHTIGEELQKWYLSLG